jgi:hypothetical protein
MTSCWHRATCPPRIERDEVADQDWMQLAWLLRYECRDLFIEMLLVLRAKARAHDLGLDDEDAEEDDGKVDLADTDRGRATPGGAGPGRRIRHLSGLSPTMPHRSPLPLPPSRCTMRGRSSKRRCIMACSTA